jgi:hypothetical protein
MSQDPYQLVALIHEPRRLLFDRKAGNALFNADLATNPKVRKHQAEEKLRAGGKIQMTQCIPYSQALGLW